MQNFLPPFPKLASGRGSVKVSSPPQTLDQMLAMVRHFNPNSGVKQPKVFGRLDGFKPMTIPIVFHRECGWLSALVGIVIATSGSKYFSALRVLCGCLQGLLPRS